MVEKCKYYKYMYTEISKYTKMKRNKPEQNKALDRSLSPFQPNPPKPIKENI